MANKHWSIASLLIKSGADINIKFYSNDTLLHIAVFYEQLEIVKLLISNGAILNALNNLKTTPLHSAIEKGNLEIVKILLENGADLWFKQTAQS